MAEIMSEGLKSRKKLSEEGRMNLQDDGSYFTNQPQYIYFKPIPEQRLTVFEGSNLIAIKVDPSDISVFNMEFRPYGNLSGYILSQRPLLTCISNILSHDDDTSRMPGYYKSLDPFTSRVVYKQSESNGFSGGRFFCGNDLNKRVPDSYFPEVLCSEEHIPAHKLALIYSKSPTEKLRASK